MQIINMLALAPDQREGCARILCLSLPIGWPKMEDARKTVEQSTKEGGCAFAMVEEGQVLAWGGLIPQYDGRVMELHPLAVTPDRQGQGIGSELLAALENVARALSGKTIMLGCDDERGETSLSGAPLFEGLPQRLAEFTPGEHVSGFYMKKGYGLIGVVPDANGVGKPDILMGKRL